MSIAANVVVGLVAALHLYFLVLEMFLWDTPTGHKTFGLEPAFAAESKTLAANQGLYNGFLAAGLVWGLVDDLDDVKLFFLACVIVAGAYGAVTVNRGSCSCRRYRRWSGSCLSSPLPEPSSTSSRPERLEVVGRLAAQLAPLPLLADGGGEAEARGSC